ncbi:oxidative stress induced growth inhibitor 1 [Latimeria chalumnae]|uniref:Oxidative stress-induced growth inhibitor 1 n=1 Tax=Latimeria chalumnae TaxID=7897 RepID=H3BI53_LATCH|nr:PREDICTED: oxidative stress-induced growth inhibitor 2-like [Latimeria chalumnae]XP_014342600.1 PREDICTED: oxidative stress-induced growth inhibitor 2-like [Latimeria chalumnae]|eukprot:XP_005986797.1 PREDICTED: oxidative stress-induced growth inhibitor 2-like [Latimeria chalumnae]
MKEEFVLNDQMAIPVLIIGNGPSGICLSYLLSGYRPYLKPGETHPNPILQKKLEERPDLSLVDQDLEYLSEGLEGRSSNPVALLFDTLLLPDGDFGLDYPSPLEWRFENNQRIPHLVLGRGLPGGAWHAMEGSMLTLSLANWMELPGLDLKDWVREKRRNLRNDRATPNDIASYYQHFVKEMGLESNFVCNMSVTSVRKILHDCKDLETESGNCSKTERTADWISMENDQENSSMGRKKRLWEVTGYQNTEGGPIPFSMYAKNVVLATGTYDKPARLEVEGEDLPFVCHSICEFEAALAQGKIDETLDPILIVGAGLTAADALLYVYHLNIPVCHAFRRAVTDSALIFNQLPKVLYPEYHKVFQMMQQQQVGSVEAGSYSGYTSYPKHWVSAFKPDNKCILENAEGKMVLKISMALVLIGTHPNLSFLKDNGTYLGISTGKPISCRQNPMDINPYTYEAVQEPNLFAVGPLVGDNFVRFVKGGAVGITSCLVKRQKAERPEFSPKRCFEAKESTVAGFST